MRRTWLIETQTGDLLTAWLRVAACVVVILAGLKYLL